jgi:fluoroquinolone transport system permease protein
VTATLRADAIRLIRDRFLLGTALYLLGISVAMRWVIPWVARGVDSRWDLDLTPYYALIVSHVVIQLAPLLVGIIGAFLLLESREQRIIKALIVSPLRVSSYLLWLSGAMVCASTIIVAAEAPIIGVGLPPWPALMASGVTGSLAAPAFALGVAAFAANKTEAFAYLKIIGTVPLLASGAYFLAEPFQWIAAVYPPYLAVKAYWVAEAGGSGWPLWIAGGALTSSMWIVALQRSFVGSARRG